MSKRASRGPPLGAAPRKRLKVVHEPPTSEDVHSSRQLRQLLIFEQDLTKARHGLQSFKVLLDGLSNEEERAPHSWDILTQYLHSTTPQDDGEGAERIWLTDIMETWSFAAEVHNDDILSAVPVVLALLLKVLARDPDLWPQALGICRTLLQRRRLELLARNLSADKGKAFIISPTLRLVREAMCFDGGALARAFFRARKHTMHSLSRNMRIKHLGDGFEDPKRPSARTSAVRLFMASLRFLHWEAKRELLKERDLVSGLTSSIKEDPPSLVLEVLDTLKRHVLSDRKLPLDAKGKLLNSTTLTRLAHFYSGFQQSSPADPQDSKALGEAVHDFLMAACTSPDAGVLRPELGLYPHGVNLSTAAVPDPGAGSEASLDRIVWIDKFKEDVPVYNLALSEFIKTLRPWTSTRQNELVVAILRAAPELVSNYFLSKKALPFEPKLSATWIGYAALLFSTIQLPLPPFFGSKLEYAAVPPPVSIVLDNVLPVPLSQKVLVRCLSQDSKLVSFFAARLLGIALQKLDVALAMMQEAAAVRGPLWSDAARRLTDEFCQRTPGLNYVINLFRGISDADILFREAASRLLRLYYHVIPQVALLAKFDVSPFLVNAIKRLGEEPGPSPQDRGLLLGELDNILAVAKASPGMRWFARMEELSLSPFTALLKVYVGAPEGVALEPLEEILDFVAIEHEVFLSSSEGFSLRHFVVCLKALQDWTSRQTGPPDPGFWGFIDNCLQRCAAAPIRYLSVAEESYSSTGTATGPLVMAILEQLPFLRASSSPAVVDSAVEFVSIYIAAARNVSGEDEALFSAILERSGATGAVDVPAIDPIHHPPRRKHPSIEANEPEAQVRNTPATGPSAEGLLQSVASEPSHPEHDNSALLKWTVKSAADFVEEGFAASLINLLSSTHISIRKEALTNVLKMAAKLKESSYEEKEQVWLLLSELAESSRGFIDKNPIPGPIVAFARHALDVLKNPLHPLYDKVNLFLTRGPVWSLDKLPLVHDVLLEEPGRDDSYYSSISWLLGYLLEALRTPADVALFHDRRLYERVFSLAGNGYMRPALRSLLLRIVYRTTCIEGGSNTLITRFGVLAWLAAEQSQARRVGSHIEADVLWALQKRVWDTCDQKRINEWSRNGAGLVMGDLD